MRSLIATVFVVSYCLCAAVQAAGPVTGWLNWRGPQQAGASAETNLPDTAGLGSLDWVVDLSGRGTAVVSQPAVLSELASPRLYAWGYEGDGLTKREVLVCLDARTGAEHWRRAFNDFLSDPIYSRYAIGAPTVDAESGRVYLMTTPGLLVCLTPDGEQLWERSMMEEFGRLTFPNGRTGAPAIDGGLVIVNAISSNWGGEGPARNRFYAFNKKTGAIVWSSDPGVGPPYLKDSSMCTPTFETRGDYRVFYAGLGDGNVVCVNARTGEPIWRYQFAVGGINASMVIAGNKLIAIHGKENLNTTKVGGMIAIDLDKAWATWAKHEGAGPAVLGDAHVLWRNDLVMFTSSPTLVGDRVYQTTHTGELACVDVNSGEVLWEQKLAPSQLHASPLYADGKLYVPFWNGSFYVIEPSDDGPKVLSKDRLAGSAIGSPSAWGGRVYVHSTEKLYCFESDEADDLVGGIVGKVAEGADAVVGAGGDVIGVVADVATAPIREKHTLQVSPSDVLLRPGETQRLVRKAIDRAGKGVMTIMIAPRAEPWVPPTAKVKAKLDATSDGNSITANASAKYSAGAFKVTQGPSGTFRGRILPAPPYGEDFEAFGLTASDADGAFGWPPLPWIGARLKWQVREDPTDPTNKVLAKTIDRVLFQRSTVFIGHPDDAGYTVTVNVMSDGSRRSMGTVGVVNQRYIIALNGNSQTIEAWSNNDNYVRARKIGQGDNRVPFKWKKNQWYTLKTRVDVNADGSGVVRAKAWPKAEAEPGAWMLNLNVPYANTKGSPGIYGFTPMSRFKVYVDDIRVDPNE